MKNKALSTPTEEKTPPAPTIESKAAFSARSLRGLFRPSVVVGVLYIALIGLVAATKHYSAFDFVHMGTVWGAHDPSGTWGYDGQFYYQLARNPLQAYHYMDNAPFRYQHILYPMVVGALSLGQTTLIPYMLLLVNVLSVVLSVEMLSRVLVKYEFSPWFSLAIGLYFGQAAATLFDTAEPFTYFLVCLGVWILLEKNRVGLAALMMGLATLAREIAVLFPLGYVCVFFVQRKWRAFAEMVLLGVAPLIIWLIALRLIFGQTGVTFTRPFEHIPFAGIFAHADAPKKFYLLLLLMFLPTLAGWVLAAVDLFRKVIAGQGPFLQRFSPMYLILLANLLMITLMSRSSYDELISSGRIATGLVLAVLFYGIGTRNKWVLWGAQFYTFTFLVYVVGTLLGWPSFIAS
jgi:hypothetical protein